MIPADGACPDQGEPGRAVSFLRGVMVPPSVIVPRPDGLITRAQAAALCGVTPEAVTNWTRGYGPRDDRRKLPVAKRINGHPLFDPVEVAKAKHATDKRARRAA